MIWNALILHARWGGMVKPRGIALLAIAGNIVVGWSYFGTNLLGVGLHAYGFKVGTKNALIFFSLSQLLLITIGLVPKKLWPSLQLLPPAPPPDDHLPSPPPGPRTAISASS